MARPTLDRDVADALFGDNAVPDELPAEEQLAAELLEGFVSAKIASRSARPKSVTNAVWSRLCASAKNRTETGQWDGARPGEFVALYALLYEMVYGTAPTHLTPAVRFAAVCAAHTALRRDHDGDPVRMALYLRWVWTREAERHAWRLSKQIEPRPLGWRLVFGPVFVAEWRVVETAAAARTG